MIKNYLRLLPRYGISYWFDFGTHMIPHPEKAHKGGEDACYANKNMIVVADGVGGWADVI